MRPRYPQKIAVANVSEFNPSREYNPAFEARFFSPRFWPTWLVLGLFRLSLLVPRRIMGWLASLAGDLLYASNRKRRDIVGINIRLAFPDWTAQEQDRLARDHFRVFAQCLFDLPVLWWARSRYLDRYVRIKGLEQYRKFHDQGRSIILLTGHFVALELGGVMISRHFPQIGLIKPARNPLVNWYVHRGRTRFGARLFLRDEGMRSLVRAIKAGYGFYYLPDEDHGPDKSVFAPFLGSDAATIRGAAKLITLCDAVAMPAYVKRLPAGKGYELIIKPPLQDFPANNDEEDALRINQSLEASVRDVPAQYMWTFRRYHTRPDNQPSPYARARHHRRKQA